MKELIHIVGLNNEYKDDFISKIHIASPNYYIIDVDDLTQKIKNDKKMAKLYDDYEKNKGDKNKAKKIGTDINTEWAKELQMSRIKIVKRLRRGWTVNETLSRP